MSRPPVLAYTPGEPAGIGPDLAVRLAGRLPECRVAVIADPKVLEQRAERLGVRLDLRPWEAARPPAAGGFAIVPIEAQRPVRPGRLDPANAPYVLETLRRAVSGCLAGEFDALVTGPVHKGVINEAGIAFSGHTEFLAEAAGVAQPVMMLAAKELRVALLTTHLPLAEIPRHITRERLQAVLRVLHGGLRENFGAADPCILVCGLNPHAGEDGHLGREEIDVIAPTLERLRAEGMRLIGPVPADTAFTPERLTGVDAVLAMYHDQGLPVLKHYGFGRAVNITLGLPFVRTSVDHGTALDRAGGGRIRTGSLEAAIRTALAMLAARRRREGRG